MTWGGLSFINSVANTARWREHVTLYAKENPQALKCLFLEAGLESRRPDLSFTIDQLQEYLYTREIAGSFNTIDFSLKNLIEVADESPVRTVAV